MSTFIPCSVRHSDRFKYSFMHRSYPVFWFHRYSSLYRFVIFKTVYGFYSCPVQVIHRAQNKKCIFLDFYLNMCSFTQKISALDSKLYRHGFFTSISASFSFIFPVRFHRFFLIFTQISLRLILFSIKNLTCFDLYLLKRLVFCPNDFYIYSRKSKLLLDLYIKRNALIIKGLIIIKVNETKH